MTLIARKATVRRTRDGAVNDGAVLELNSDSLIAQLLEEAHELHHLWSGASVAVLSCSPWLQLARGWKSLIGQATLKRRCRFSSATNAIRQHSALYNMQWGRREGEQAQARAVRPAPSAPRTNGHARKCRASSDVPHSLTRRTH